MHADSMLLATRGMRSPVPKTYDFTFTQDYIHVSGRDATLPPSVRPMVIKFCVFHPLHFPSTRDFPLRDVDLSPTGDGRGNLSPCFARRENERKRWRTVENAGRKGGREEGGTSSSSRSFHESFRAARVFPPLKAADRNSGIAFNGQRDSLRDRPGGGTFNVGIARAVRGD